MIDSWNRYIDLLKRLVSDRGTGDNLIGCLFYIYVCSGKIKDSLTREEITVNKNL